MSAEVLEPIHASGSARWSKPYRDKTTNQSIVALGVLVFCAGVTSQMIVWYPRSHVTQLAQALFGVAALLVVVATLFFWLLPLAPKLPTAIPDEPSRTAQCVPHPPPAVISSPRIPWSRRGAGVPPHTPPSLVWLFKNGYIQPCRYDSKEFFRRVRM
jgi:hypothetical protein